MQLNHNEQTQANITMQCELPKTQGDGCEPHIMDSLCNSILSLLLGIFCQTTQGPNIGLTYISVERNNFTCIRDNQMMLTSSVTD